MRDKLSQRLAPCQSIVHDQQCLFGFQRQLYRLDFAASKAQRKRSPDGYRHSALGRRRLARPDEQPSLVRGPFDSSAVHSCFLPAFEPDRLRNAEPGEQISWNEQRVDLGEGDQRSGIKEMLYDDSHAETSLVSLSVVSSLANDLDAQAAQMRDKLAQGKPADFRSLGKRQRGANRQSDRVTVSLVTTTPPPL